MAGDIAGADFVEDALSVAGADLVLASASLFS